MGNKPTRAKSPADDVPVPTRASPASTSTSVVDTAAERNVAAAAEPPEKDVPNDDDAPIPRPSAPPRIDETFDMNDSVDDVGNWLRSELADMSISRDYPELIEECVDVMKRWKTNMPKAVWLRVMKAGRLAKELNESAPVIVQTREWVNALKVSRPEDRAVIVDLCSGFGYLGMFLSEMLPRDKVAEIILVDKMWAMFNRTPQSHHISWDHVYGVDGWKYDWPIEMTTRKVNLKDSAQMNQMAVHLFTRYEGPFIVLGIHLCGILSIKAVEMFNKHSNVSHLVLKPCCLPDFSWTYRADHFEVGKHKHRIPTKEVCSRGKWKKNKWVGPPRHYLKAKFEAWGQHLCQSIEDEDGNIRKRLEEIRVQTAHFQNTFIFSERERVERCTVRAATGLQFPTPSGTDAGRWAPTGAGYGTHVRLETSH
jgi:hypothetical protein